MGSIINPANFGCQGLGLVSDFGGDWNDWLAYQEASTEFLTLCVPAGTFDVGHVAAISRAPGGVIQGAGEGSTTIEQLAGFTNRHVIGKDGYGDGDNATAGGPYQPRIATVSAGATSVTVISSWEDLDYWFEVGTPVLIAGFDVMGFGAPINNQFFEYNRVASLGFSPGDNTGTIGLETPLIHSYNQNWPVIYGGDTFQPDHMGSPGILAMHPYWDGTFITKDFTWDTDFGIGSIQGSAGRICLLENITFTQDQLIPTVAENFTYRNCQLTGHNIEVDKLIQTLEFDNCTSTGFVHVQSGCIGNLIISDSSFSTLIGTAGTTTISNTTINDLRVGPTSYGVQLRPITLDNVNVTLNNSLTGRPCDASNFTLSAGVLTIATTDAISTDPDVFGSIVPGGWYVMFYTGNSIPAGVFGVTDVQKVGSNFEYTTTLPDPFPQWLGLPVTHFQAHPGPWMTVTNTTSGNLRYRSYAAGANRPYGGYGKSDEISFTNVFPYVSFPGIQCFGNLEQITINVTKAYTGSQGTLQLAPLCYLDTNFTPLEIIHEDGTTSLWRPYVNLKTTGVRVLTSGSITGAVTGDSLSPGWTGDAEWVWLSQPSMNVDISSESSSVWPEVEIEVIMNHGIPPP